MAEKFKFDLVSPESLVLSAEVDAVTIAGVEGDFTVLAHHAAAMSVIRPGTLIVTQDGDETRYHLDGGFADVTLEGVTVLAESISAEAS